MNIKDLPADLLAQRAHLFSPTTVRVASDAVVTMTKIIAAVERVIAMPVWHEYKCIAQDETAYAAAQRAAGVFISYDFHLSPQGPQLIEINSNAAGGLFSALQAQRQDLLEAYVAMFRDEHGQRGLQTIAIVDEQPLQQYYYPEFLGFKQLFIDHGIDAVICDPTELLQDAGVLRYQNKAIDLVYNRLTDFDLAQPQHSILRNAWLAGQITLTPHPVTHVLYADKRNLIALSDAELLQQWGLDDETRQIMLTGIPRTEEVNAEAEEYFRQHKNKLFFKPATGYGGRGSYRGDRMTRRVFAEVLKGGYVAQAFAQPSTTDVIINGETQPFKTDLRCYVYRGEMQLMVARLYRGQTTNFRTPGGGFAIVREV